MNEFLENNEALNYAYHNPEKSNLDKFIPFIVTECAKSNPGRLESLSVYIDLLTIPGVLSSKKDYEGVPEVAQVCLQEIEKYTNNKNMSQASMRK